MSSKISLLMLTFSKFGLLICLSMALLSCGGERARIIQSPDGGLSVTFGIAVESGAPYYRIELALPTLFHSGIQHLVEIPQAMDKVPSFVKEYLSALPVQWDETRLVAGFPGELAVLARRSGEDWYVAGINGEAVEKEISLDLGFLSGYSGIMIGDGGAHPDFALDQLEEGDANTVSLKPNGGFVMKLSK